MILSVDINLRSKHTIYTGFPAKNEIPFPEETVESFRGLMCARGKKVKFEFASKMHAKNSAEKTVVIINKDDVLISRLGQFELNMVFRKEGICECVHLDPYRQMNIKINTTKLENTISAKGGTLQIDYSVEIFGSIAEENSLTFTVKPIDKEVN